MEELELGHQSVLGNGYVRYVEHMGTDVTIVEAARMSTGKGFLGWEPQRLCVMCGVPQALYEKTLGAQNYLCGATAKEHRWADHKGDAHLLEFLYKNSHMTPFEMCDLHVEVYAPIEVFRQWQRHRMFSYNEFSARYAQMPNEHYVPELDRFKPKYTSNKQESSAAIEGGDDLQVELNRRGVIEQQERLYAHYETMIETGVPKETARINTPVSRFSKMRAKTDLRNWLGFLKLRMDEHAQWEIRQYANAVGALVKELWPRTWALFEEYTFYAKTFSRSEMVALRASWNDMGPEMQKRIEAKLK